MIQTPNPSLAKQESPNISSNKRSNVLNKDKQNWLIHVLFLRQEYDECVELIGNVLKDTDSKSEYALYIKALIERMRGNIHESLECFKQCHIINPNNVDCQKQVGKALYLLGKHKAAIDVYESAENIRPNDWEIYYHKGLSYISMKMLDQAIKAFDKSNSIQKHDITFIQLGKAKTLKGDLNAAITTYLEALEISPENPEILTTIGLLYIRIGENFHAFQFLGNAFSLDPKNTKTILATGSIIQDKSDHDAALLKYRIAAVYNPNSAQLWNNIGMCFFGKQKYVAAIACLKRALYLEPFEWIISYNLGLVFLNTGQYVSACHAFSTAIHLNPEFPSTYMYLAIALNKLNDFQNACAAFDRSLKIEKDMTCLFNYSITLLQNDETEKAKEQFELGEKMYQELDEESKQSEPDVLKQRKILALHLNIKISN